MVSYVYKLKYKCLVLKFASETSQNLLPNSNGHFSNQVPYNKQRKKKKQGTHLEARENFFLISWCPRN